MGGFHLYSLIIYTWDYAYIYCCSINHGEVSNNCCFLCLVLRTHCKSTHFCDLLETHTRNNFTRFLNTIYPDMVEDSQLSIGKLDIIGQQQSAFHPLFLWNTDRTDRTGPAFCVDVWSAPGLSSWGPGRGDLELATYILAGCCTKIMRQMSQILHNFKQSRYMKRFMPMKHEHTFFVARVRIAEYFPRSFETWTVVALRNPFLSTIIIHSERKYGVEICGFKHHHAY